MHVKIEHTQRAPKHTSDHDAHQFYVAFSWVWVANQNPAREKHYPLFLLPAQGGHLF